MMNEENKNATSEPRIELSMVKNGTVNSTPILGDNIIPVPEKKEKKKNSVAIYIVLGVVLVFVTFLMLVVNFKDQFANRKSAYVKNENLVYENPGKNDIVDFQITETLVMQMKVTDIIDEGDNNLVIYDLYIKGSNNILSNNTTWMEKNKILVPFKQVGDSFIIVDDDLNDYQGVILDVFSSDGTLNVMDEMDLNLKGLYIKDYTVTHDSLILTVSRVSELNYYIYYNGLYSDINGQVVTDVGEDRFTYENGISICTDSINQIPGETLVNATYEFNLVDGKLVLNNPSITDTETLTSFIESKKADICQ